MKRLLLFSLICGIVTQAQAGEGDSVLTESLLENEMAFDEPATLDPVFVPYESSTSGESEEPGKKGSQRPGHTDIDCSVKAKWLRPELKKIYCKATIKY